MVRNANPVNAGSRVGCNNRSRSRANSTSTQDRKWQRAAVIGTWLDSLARLLDALTKLR
jgi:hypothetical protein